MSTSYTGTTEWPSNRDPDKATRAIYMLGQGRNLFRELAKRVEPGTNLFVAYGAAGLAKDWLAVEPKSLGRTPRARGRVPWPLPQVHQGC